MNPAAALPCELRPRDFSARLKRSRARSLAAAQRRPHRGRRAALLLAAIAVPALAAPGGWSNLGASLVAAQAAQPGAPAQAMPFETAGASFPGSAFY